jgi:DNA-binding response OmpR family regulator
MGLSGASRILVVDHPEVQAVIRNILEGQGYTVSGVTPAEALDWLANRGPEIDLLITNSLDCIAPAAPHLPVLCLSVIPEEEFRACCGERRCRMIRKPFRAHDLVETVRGLLGTA